MEVAVNAFLRSDEYGNFISLSQKLIAKPSDQSNLEAGPVKYTLNNRADLKPAIAAVALRRSGLGRQHQFTGIGSGHSGLLLDQRQLTVRLLTDILGSANGSKGR